MQVDKLADNGEAETQTTVLASAAGVTLLESIEDSRCQFGCYSLATIGHTDLDVIADLLQTDIDIAAVGCELYGVVHQIPQDLLDPRGISRNPAAIGLQRLFDAD